MIRARLVLAVLALGCFMASGAGATNASGDDLDAVMQLLAKRTHARSNFIEQHFLKMLKQPVESRGDLAYDAPNRLEKKTIEPRAETLLVDGDVLTIERGHRRQMLNLRDYPALAPFIEGLRATLAGDRTALERIFDVTFTGSLPHWSLVLVPRAGSVAKSVASIEIDGMQDDLLRIEILQPDGDRSLMTMRRAAAP